MPFIHRLKLRALAPLALVVSGFVTPGVTHAQDVPGGVAVVQAPEQSSGIAFGSNREATIRDAVRQCTDGGALEQDCIVTNWCAPAGWTIDLFVQHREGLHWHETICGIADKSVIPAMETALCDGATRPYLMECAVVQVWDPQGTPTMEW